MAGSRQVQLSISCFWYICGHQYLSRAMHDLLLNDLRSTTRGSVQFSLQTSQYFRSLPLRTGCAHVCEVSGGCLLCGDRFDCGLQIQSRCGQQGQSCGVGSIPAGGCLLSGSLSGGFQGYMARTKVSMLTSQGVGPHPLTYYSCFVFHWSPY